MPPKRVPIQLSLSSGSQSIVEESADETSNGLNEYIIDTRGGHNDSLRKLVQEKGKLPITFRKCDGRPVGTYVTKFTIELRLFVKSYAPLQVKVWKNITNEQKQPMFDRLQNYFDVDFGTGPNCIRKVVDVWMGERYRDNRSKMLTHYRKNSHLPWEMRVEKTPKHFHGELEDWSYLCTLFESEKFKARSEKNTANRAKLKVNHRGGSKSFVRHSYETGDEPREVNRVELYKKTHWNKDKGWANGAQDIHIKMVKRFDELKETFQPCHESAAMTDIEIADQVCDEILGTRSGFIPGLGHGPKPSKLLAGYNKSTNAQLRDQLKSTQDELESTRTTLQSLQENMNAFAQVIQKIAHREYQSIIETINTSTPSL